MAHSSENRIAIAYVSRSKGIKGWVLAEPLTMNMERFNSVTTVELQSNNVFDGNYTLEKWRPEGPSILLKFAGIETPELARELLVKRYVTVALSEVPKLPEGEYYTFEIIGCNVEDKTGNCIGEVREVLSLESNDVYVIDGPNGEVLVPAVKDIVTSVDLNNRRILVSGIEELLQ